MLKFFSLPIGVGIACGAIWPYQSMSLIWMSSILLFLLLFLNTLGTHPKQLMDSARRQGAQVFAAQFLIFLFFPLLIAAAAQYFVRDHDFAFGLVVSALAPCALVNPFFARLRSGDSTLALLNVIVSTLLCPLLTVPLLKLLGYESVYLDSRYTILYLSALTVFPVLFSFAAGTFRPAWREWLTPWLPVANSLILGLLLFILVGSSLSRVPLRLLAQGDLPALIVFYLIADFGFYFVVRGCAALFTGAAAAETLALSVASRNFAVGAGLMLFFHPKAALPAAIGLSVHALFFQFLTWRNPTAVDSALQSGH